MWFHSFCVTQVEYTRVWIFLPPVVNRTALECDMKRYRRVSGSCQVMKSNFHVKDHSGCEPQYYVLVFVIVSPSSAEKPTNCFLWLIWGLKSYGIIDATFKLCPLLVCLWTATPQSQSFFRQTYFLLRDVSEVPYVLSRRFGASWHRGLCFPLCGNVKTHAPECSLLSSYAKPTHLFF